MTSFALFNRRPDPTLRLSASFPASLAVSRNITSKTTPPINRVSSGKKRHRGRKHSDKQQEDDRNEKSLEVLMNETDLLGNISIKHLRALALPQKPAKTPEEALTKSYQFWNTQPVPKMGLKVTGLAPNVLASRENLQMRR